MTGKEGPLPVPRGVYVCADCGAPVRDAVVGRRKVLGAYVPVWGAGPCENPDCREPVSEERTREERTREERTRGERVRETRGR